MTLHCGLWFYALWPDFYKHLHQIVNPAHQLSYFTLLQQPDSGGELSIFDFCWKEEIKKIPDSLTRLTSADEIFSDRMHCKFPLSINEGDLIIFDGGEIWHRVEIVNGEKNRITFGGFLGLSKNDEIIYHWT